METVPRCLLLPIDGTEDSLRPVEFLNMLYPDKSAIQLILSYFIPPLAPMFRELPDSEGMAKKKRQLLDTREADTRRVLNMARNVLIRAGFSEEAIQEQVEEKALSVAHHACRLADIRKADAVVVQKRASSSLESFLKGDSSPELLHHCLVSPVWLTEGTIDPSHAAICVQNQQACLRAVDHAAFMLAETRTRVTLLHISHSVFTPISSPVGHPTRLFEQWMNTDTGKELSPLLGEVCGILKRAGVGDERLQVAILPVKGKLADEILAYCRDHGIGIAVIGHSNPGGAWNFLRTSLTQKIIADFRNMAVWVAQ